MDAQYLLVSHALCPYVQRAAIVLAEKNISYERRDIDLGNKPDWFLALSPLGKTPVLVVNGTPIFESAVICEYLDESTLPRLHPEDPLERAQHRAWIEFGSVLLNGIGSFYSAPDDTSLNTRAQELRRRLEQIESTLGVGPYFRGEHFSMVDATFGPAFRYFDVFETIEDFGFFNDLPKTSAWRLQLATRPSVIHAVQHDYPQQLYQFLIKRRSALSRRIEAKL